MKKKVIAIVIVVAVLMIVGNNKEVEVIFKFKNEFNKAMDYLKRHNL